MLWVFQRGAESQQLETRYDNDTAEYVLIIHSPNGSQQVERFADAVTFGKRLESLEQQLAGEHWTATGAPVLLRDGWKI